MSTTIQPKATRRERAQTGAGVPQEVPATDVPCFGCSRVGHEYLLRKVVGYRWWSMPR